MKRIIFLFMNLLLLEIILAGNDYASEWHLADKGFHLYNHYNECVLNETKREVSFTQDDDYYYYDIKQSLKKDGLNYRAKTEYIYNNKSLIDKKLSGYTGDIKTFFVCMAPFSNINALYEEWEETGSEYNYLFNVGGWEFYHYYYLRSGKVKVDTKDSIIFVRDKMYGNTTGHEAPVVYDVSVSNEVKSEYEERSMKYYSSISFDLSYKIKIKKTEINTFRYCMPLAGMYIYNPSDSKNASGISLSVSSAIDLNNYTKCDHNWVYDCSRDEHSKYCEKCKWKVKEKHDFIYEYDGILNNRCACGENKNVKINIYDNINKINLQFISTPSYPLEKIKIENVGYTLKYISDTEKVYNEKKYVYAKSTISEIPKYVPDNSHTYILNYKTHQYYINYKKNNSYNLNIYIDMPSKIVNYDEKTKLDKTLYEKKGYTFLGWGVMPDIKKVVFVNENEIYNISAEDGYELNLYPVYDPYKYTVRFLKGRGTGYMTDQICTYGVKENLKSFEYALDEDASFLNWIYKGDDIKPNTTDTLEKYVYNNNAVIVLDSKFHIREKNNRGSNENSPSKNGGYNNINKGENGYPNNSNEDNNENNEKNNKNENAEINYVNNENNILNEKKDNEKNEENIKEKINLDYEENLDDINNKYYMSIATSSITKINNNNFGRKIALIDGLLLFLQFGGRMLFCVVLVITVFFLIFLLMYIGKKEYEKIKKN